MPESYCAFPRSDAEIRSEETKQREPPASYHAPPRTSPLKNFDYFEQNTILPRLRTDFHRQQLSTRRRRYQKPPRFSDRRKQLFPKVRWLSPADPDYRVEMMSAVDQQKTVAMRRGLPGAEIHSCVRWNHISPSGKMRIRPQPNGSNDSRNIAGSLYGSEAGKR